MQRLTFVTLTVSVVASAAVANAHPCPQEEHEACGYGYEEAPHGFFELFGNWGVNLGQRDYLPDGAPNESKHPFASGFGAGATLGLYIVPEALAVIADYRYGHTSTREGELTGALDEVQGTLNFHTLTVGMRVENRLGRGRMYGQLLLGVMLPYHTTLTFDYAPELAAIGITGEGTRKEHFGIAFGAQGELGYLCDLGERMYIGAGIRVAAFQGNNAGEDTELRNFVTDFRAPIPRAVTTNIGHSKDGIPPSTGSVQDIRFQLSIGTVF